jgi:hypothetical protein
VLSLLTVSATTQGAVILNGDFEDLGGLPGHNGSSLPVDLNTLAAPGWGVFSVVGQWTAFAGAGVEIQRNTIIQAHSGRSYVELDSHPSGKPGDDQNTNSGMKRDVFFDPGDYLLNFWYRPRTNIVGSNGVLASVADTGGNLTLASTVADGLAADFPDWKLYQLPFGIVTAGQYEIRFQADGIADQLGGFLDTVSVTTAPIPEPATFVSIAIGLGLFLVGRRFA